MSVQESPPYPRRPGQSAQEAAEEAENTDPASQTPETTDPEEWTHILFDIKTSPKKMSGILLESLHHKLHRSEVKVYSSFNEMRADGAVKLGNVVFALPTEGMDDDKAILAARKKLQYLIMDWDKNELSGEGLSLVVEDETCPWGWEFLPYQDWKEQRKRR
ncbi:hypothetical protein CDV55_106395 [Aspergillus turcosus]|uniref:Uncharacterized protein n=1 Tax=Aspergillus turcosus TaxID=1245748 RepID=A0A229XI78_9EURO|nr:hypothetical protein CDV55_106395 [Aspergillus turcosus]RLL97208.1 hypothetical protein CFD26_106006 [Aspergillus turcosus]